MIQRISETLDASIGRFFEAVRQSIQNLAGKLQYAVIPEEQRGNLQYVTEKITSFRIRDQQRIAGVGRRKRDVGPECPQIGKDGVDVAGFPGSQARYVDLNQIRAHFFQITDHIEREPVIDRAEPSVRRYSDRNFETPEGLGGN